MKELVTHTGEEWVAVQELENHAAAMILQHGCGNWSAEVHGTWQEIEQQILWRMATVTMEHDEIP